MHDFRGAPRYGYGGAPTHFPPHGTAGARHKGSDLHPLHHSPQAIKWRAELAHASGDLQRTRSNFLQRRHVLGWRHGRRARQGPRSGRARHGGARHSRIRPTLTRRKQQSARRNLLHRPHTHKCCLVRRGGWSHPMQPRGGTVTCPRGVGPCHEGRAQGWHYGACDGIFRAHPFMKLPNHAVVE